MENANELYQAYVILGLEPGSSLEAILNRYRQLIMIWHPDRVTSEEQKKFAEAELKKINNAKDILVAHFGSGIHTTADCVCRSSNDKHHAQAEKDIAREPPFDYTSKTSTERQDREAWWQNKLNSELDAWNKQLGGLAAVLGLMLLFLFTVIVGVGNAFRPYTQSTINNRQWEVPVPTPVHSRSSYIAYQKRMNQDCAREELEKAIALRQMPVSVNNFPVANLPKTPGIDVSLPRQSVHRAGLPLVPLGGNH
jgi:hypothetical protein